MLMSALIGFIAPTVVHADSAALAAPVLVALPDFSVLVDKVGPAVVNIRTTAKSQDSDSDADDEKMKELFKRFFGVPVPAPGSSPKSPAEPEAKKKSPEASDIRRRPVLSAFSPISFICHPGNSGNRSNRNMPR